MEKIIHQIWIGPYKIPKLEEYFSKIMKEKKPDFEYMLWTNIKIYGMKVKVFKDSIPGFIFTYQKHTFLY